jgi:hypothetical protein
MYVTPDDTYLKEESDNGSVQYKVVGKWSVFFQNKFYI